MLVAAPDRVVEAATRLGRIGFDNVAGYLDGGMQARRAVPDLIERGERITAATLAEQLSEPDPPLVLDVRAEDEVGEVRVEGSLNIPLSRLLEHLDELPRDRADRRPLLERLPLRRGRQPAPAGGLRPGLGSGRRAQPAARAAVRSASLSTVFQLR